MSAPEPTGNVEEPPAAWAYLRDIWTRSDPAREGGPEVYVPDLVRTALHTAIVDHDDLEGEAEEWREKIGELLKRAQKVCAGPAYAKLRADIEQALKDVG